MDPEPEVPRVVRPPKGPAGRDQPSLNPPLLSGRSLDPVVKAPRFDSVREHRSVVVSCVAVVVLILLIGVGKWAAERAADSATQGRAAQIEALLRGATPDDFLAFNAGVKRPGSLAVRVRDEPGFVNVKAGVRMTFIRFQPAGWWAGFTERCIVAELRPEGARVTVPKTACVRVVTPRP
ncbi:MAG: hypothetical protein WCJ04_05440 [Actinomycetes bacterium]